MTGYSEKAPYQKFKRFCKVLNLKSDQELIKKYIEAHRAENCWPEINQGIKEVGILDMEIYIAGKQLFMIMDTVPDFDHETAMAALVGKPRQAEWEAYMAQFQDTSENASAEKSGSPLSEFINWVR